MRTLLIVLLLISPAWANEAQDLAARQQELATLKARILDISRGLDADREKKSSLADQVEAVERRLGNLRTAVRRLDQDLAEQTRRARRLEGEMAGLKAQLGENRAELAAYLRAAFVLGRRRAARLMLSSQDPTRLDRLGHYLTYFDAALRRHITSLNETLAAFTERREQLAQAQANAKALKSDKSQALAALQSQRDQRQRLLDEVSRQLRAGQRDLSALRAQQANLETLIDQLQAAVARLDRGAFQGRFADHKGRLDWPLKGRILADFRQSKPDGNTRWNGWWLASPAGTPVRAIAPGRVVYVGWMHRFGLLLVLDHGDGYFSLYGHNSSVRHAVGDEVSAGEVIAAAGNTGGHGESGVYLEIRKGRRPLNPRRWLARN